MVEEVRSLYSREDLSCDLPSLRAVGYRQICDYLDDKFTYSEMIDKAIIASGKLAKRQLPWLRAEVGATWFDSTRQDFVPRVLKFVEAAIHL